MLSVIGHGDKDGMCFMRSSKTLKTRIRVVLNLAIGYTFYNRDLD